MIKYPSYLHPTRVPVTAQFAFDNLCDEPLWMYVEETEDTEPWVEITGMDRETRGEQRFILEFGRTGEKYVPADFILFAQKSSMKKLEVASNAVSV